MNLLKPTTPWLFSSVESSKSVMSAKNLDESRMIPLQLFKVLCGDEQTGTSARLSTLSKFVDWALVEHSIRMAPDRSFLMDLTSPAMPCTDFDSANGLIFKVFVGSGDSITMKRGQEGYFELREVVSSSESINDRL